MLMHCETEKAVNYVLTMQDQLVGLGDICQLTILELVRFVGLFDVPSSSSS